MDRTRNTKRRMEVSNSEGESTQKFLRKWPGKGKGKDISFKDEWSVSY
jgi:hypothetical protein